MKKLFFTAIITAILTFQGYGQKQCDISNHYEDFITIQKSSYNENDYLTKRVIKTNKESCFSDLINNNIMFIDYLLTNFSSNSNYQDLLKLTDSVTISKKYISDLKKDSLFNSVMNELVSKTIDKKTPKDTISFDNLMNIAVKYFSIIRLTNEGHYMGKVCAGFNDIKRTEKERVPFIEAFCFSSILQHYQSKEYSMNDEFIKAIKELYKVNLGLDREEKLLRAQGAMFFLMRNNENLKSMLKSEYEKKKEHLPFILKGD
ncbi:MAG: hypothetical protein RQ866_02205 [Bacteroidales bacterium]|nr:hypothetical protein [Bacteroidales bacterium]